MARVTVDELKAALRGRWRDVLARLGLPTRDWDTRKEIPCPKCGGNTRFRPYNDFEDTGGVRCNKCHSDQNSDGIATLRWWTGADFLTAFDQLCREAGLSNGAVHSSHSPLEAVCLTKRMPLQSAIAYGARSEKSGIAFPSWGAAGQALSAFSIWPDGTDRQRKGMWPKDGIAGVFLPTVDGSPQLPQPGEKWLIVEGVKDAAALHGMGFLVLGMNTSKLSQKFVRMLRGVHVTVIPDRDSAGISGAEVSARRLFGIAASIRVSALPSEVKAKDGDDVRDILARQDGEALVREAIAEARLWELESAEISRPIVKFFSGRSSVGDLLAQVTNTLADAGDCYMRTGQLVVLRDGHLFTITKATELAGVFSRNVEFAYVEGNKVNCEPLPAKFANTWLNNYDELSRLPAINVFTRNPMYTQGYRLVQPGFDQESGIYYAGPPITPKKESCDRLNELLTDFCWKTPGDRTNYIGILLTALLMSKFIGSHPAALFNGNQPELGKSILAQVISIIRTGEPAPTCSYNRNDEEFEKTLGSRIKEGATDLIIDNAKDKGGRNAVIDSAVLERSITDHVLNYRLLGTSSSIRCENSIQFSITANGAECSRDIVIRSCAINLHYEGDPTRRAFTMADPEGYAQEHRVELLAELCGMVERWKDAGMPLAQTATRFNKKGWGNVVGGILATCGEPDFLDNQTEIAGEMDTVRREFAELVEEMYEDPRGNWSGAELVDLAIKSKVLLSHLGELSPRSQAIRLGKIATRFIAECFDVGQLKVRFFREASRDGNVYFVRDVSGLDLS
jgi:hypothetical protein